MPELPDHVLELYRARNLIEAQALLALLETAGITARVAGEDLQGSFGTIGWAFSPRVMVKAENEAEAKIILANFIPEFGFSGHDLVDSSDPCLSCGAGMELKRTCPQCGWTYMPEPEEAPVESNPKLPEPQTEVTEQTSEALISESRLGNRQLWCEVLAVLAVVCVPNFMSTIQS